MIKIDYSQFIGKRYGSLVFVKVAASRKQRRMVEVLCDCGISKEIVWDNLRRGRQKSCGCKQSVKLLGRGHSLHSVWTDMKQRCLNPNAKAYKYYGAKGVKIVDEWLTYEPFYNWAINNGWKDGLELDKDTHGGMLYGPNTCVFITHEENVRRSSKAILTIEQADSIRNSKVETRFLAKEYKVCKETIRAIRRGDTWKQ